METAVRDAVKLLAGKVTGEVKSEDAMRFTQSALNLAHVLATLTEVELRSPSPQAPPVSLFP